VVWTADRVVELGVATVVSGSKQIPKLTLSVGHKWVHELHLRLEDGNQQFPKKNPGTDHY
jgi:hypothetical protein